MCVSEASFDSQEFMAALKTGGIRSLTRLVLASGILAHHALPRATVQILEVDQAIDGRLSQRAEGWWSDPGSAQPDRITAAL
jgi:hypothetical protein